MKSEMGRWLDWQAPAKDIQNARRSDTSKTTKSNSEGFEVPDIRASQNIFQTRGEVTPQNTQNFSANTSLETSGNGQSTAIGGNESSTNPLLTAHPVGELFSNEPRGDTSKTTKSNSGVFDGSDLRASQNISSLSVEREPPDASDGDLSLELSDDVQSSVINHQASTNAPLSAGNPPFRPPVLNPAAAMGHPTHSECQTLRAPQQPETKPATDIWELRRQALTNERTWALERSGIPPARARWQAERETNEFLESLKRVSLLM